MNSIENFAGSGCIVPSWGPNKHLILFIKKKGGGDLSIYIDYRTLNSSTLNDA